MALQLLIWIDTVFLISIDNKKGESNIKRFVVLLNIQKGFEVDRKD